jgi:hypothetical protein
MLKNSVNLDVNYLKVVSTQAVSEFIKNDTIYKNGSLQVRGGAYIEKGLKIGNQDQVCNGMLFYDGENFFGHSEKLGTCLLSNHTISSELPLPLSIFDNIPQKSNQKKYTITAAQNNLTKSSSQEMIGAEEEASNDDSLLHSGTQRVPRSNELLTKNIIVDITMKDIKNFYIVIPQIYQNTNFHLNLNVTYQFDEFSYINDASLHILNQTNKSLSISCGNDSRYVYYDENFKSEVKEKSVGLYELKRITPQFLLLKSSFYKKNN